MKLLQKTKLKEKFKRYDLEIKGTHNFVAEGVVVHNTNTRIGMIEGHLVAGSRQFQREMPMKTDSLGISGVFDEEAAKSNWYWFPVVAVPGVKKLLHELSSDHRQVVLYGEVYGAGVQGGFNYGATELAYRAFDLLVDGKFVDYDTFLLYMTAFEIPTVPSLDICPFDLATLHARANGNSALYNGIKEGAVVKPVTERTQPKAGRVIFKYISDDYMLKKQSNKISDYTEA